MSALDDVIEWAKETQHEDITEAERAREELELLREAAFNAIGLRVDSMPRQTPRYVLAKERDILRTDPERAKRMGLGWAL